MERIDVIAYVRIYGAMLYQGMLAVYLKDMELVLKESFYVINKDSVLTKFSRKRKSFIELIPEHKKQEKQILRKNKIYTYNASDLVKAFSVIKESGFFNKFLLQRNHLINQPIYIETFLLKFQFAYH